MTKQLHEISHLIEPSIIWNHFCRGMLFTKKYMNIVVMIHLVIPEMTSVIDAFDQSTHLVVQFIHLKNISTGVFTNETF